MSRLCVFVNKQWGLCDRLSLGEGCVPNDDFFIFRRGGKGSLWCKLRFEINICSFSEQFRAFE